MFGAPRCKNDKIYSVLDDELGFRRSDGDPCPSVRKNDEGVMMIAFYVDYLLMVTKNRAKFHGCRTFLVIDSI